MKVLILWLPLVISSMANASPTYVVTIDDYLFTGTLTGMTDTLQEKLANELIARCGESTTVKMNNLSIDFIRGPAGSEALETQVVNNNGRLLVDFPGHPKAVITASFDCP